MSERLTSTGKQTSTSWIELAFPAALILVALYCQVVVWFDVAMRSTVESILPPSTSTAFTGLAVLFALHCGAVVRGMLPTKAPQSHKIMAAVLGALAASYPIASTTVYDMIPWVLALAAWNVYNWEVEKGAALIKLNSGISAGLACSLDPATIVVAIPLLLLTALELLRKRGDRRIVSLAWEAGLFLGLSPIFLKRVPLPSWSFQEQNLEPLLDLLTEAARNIPWAWTPFLILGAAVAAFQARKTLWGLFLPLLAGLSLLLMGSPPSTELPEMMMVPVVLLSGYGVFRVARGIEQGIRNSSPSKAKSVIPGLTVLTLLAYSGWLGYLIF